MIERTSKAANDQSEEERTAGLLAGAEWIGAEMRRLLVELHDTGEVSSERLAALRAAATRQQDAIQLYARSIGLDLTR